MLKIHPAPIVATGAVLVALTFMVSACEQLNRPLNNTSSPSSPSLSSSSGGAAAGDGGGEARDGGSRAPMFTAQPGDVQL